HPGDVLRRMEIVGVDEPPAEPCGEQAADGGLARTGDTHQHDDHGQPQRTRDLARVFPLLTGPRRIRGLDSWVPWRRRKITSTVSGSPSPAGPHGRAWPATSGCVTARSAASTS